MFYCDFIYVVIMRNEIFWRSAYVYPDSVALGETVDCIIDLFHEPIIFPIKKSQFSRLDTPIPLTSKILFRLFKMRYLTLQNCFYAPIFRRSILNS